MMLIDPELLPQLRCPGHDEHGPLEATSHGLRCPTCQATYPVVEGIPVMFSPEQLANQSLTTEQEQWDQQATHYDNLRSRDAIYMAGIRSAVAKLQLRTGDRVLDAGCGTGLSVRRYQRPDLAITALDLSLQSLLYLKKQLPPNHRVHLVCGDVAHLPFASSRFNKVLCANTIQQLPSADMRRQATLELARVGEHNARIVVSVHNYTKRKQRAGWAKEGSAGGQSGHVQYIYRYGPGEFASLLGESLRVHEITGAGLPLMYRYKLSPLMDRVEQVANRLRISTRWGNMLVAVASRA